MEVLSWIYKLCQCLKPSECIMIQACVFANYCTRLCSRIQKVLSGDSDLVLATYSSILRQMDDTEKFWSSSYNPAQHSISSIGVHAYQGNFQMHLSASVLTFLLRVCQEDCSRQQHIHSTAMQEHCIAAFRTTATTLLHAQDMPQDIGNNFNLGWADAVMVYGSLRTIATSPISLGWQGNAANKARAAIQERLGFQLWA